VVLSGKWRKQQGRLRESSRFFCMFVATATSRVTVARQGRFTAIDFRGTVCTETLGIHPRGQIVGEWEGNRQRNGNSATSVTGPFACINALPGNVCSVLRQPRGCTVAEIKNGHVVRSVVYSDRLATLQQLGVLPVGKPVAA
jgi:hypothetical protein